MSEIETSGRLRLSDLDNDDLLTISEVAQVLRVSQTTVTREINNRLLTEVRIGRRRRMVRVADLRSYIDAKRHV